jgi:hypothetical protein
MPNTLVDGASTRNDGDANKDGPNCIHELRQFLILRSATRQIPFRTMRGLVSVFSFAYNMVRKNNGKRTYVTVQGPCTRATGAGTARHAPLTDKQRLRAKIALFPTNTHKRRLIIITPWVTQAKITYELPRFGHVQCARNNIGFKD